MLALILFIALMGLSILLRLAGFLRLTIPLVYALLLPILCPEWYQAHEALGNGIFFGLLAMVALSWVFSLVRKVREWF